MSEYQHVRTSVTHDAQVSADSWMRAAADWVEQVEFLSATAPVKITKCVYAEGMRKGRYPLTRHVVMDKSGLAEAEAQAIPDTLSETLLWVDTTARMLLYRIDGEPWGMRSYFAFNEVEPLGPGGCRVTISSRFNIPQGVSAAGYLDTFRASYKTIIEGIAEYARYKQY